MNCSFFIKYTQLFVLLTTVSFAAVAQKRKLLFSDNFARGCDTSAWLAEVAPLPGSSVYTKKGVLYLDTKGGVTVWLKRKLSGNLSIEFTRKVLVDTGANDRLSDLNFFWMAGDPKAPTPFGRNGILESYDSLKLYYVGIGGNTNSTSRFRKYEGTGERRLLQEYTDSAHLLKANKDYHVIIEVRATTTSVFINGNKWFTHNDLGLLTSGYFGFRSTRSRQSIDDFKVYQLD